MMEAKTIEMSGKVFENGPELTARLGLSEYTIKKYMRERRLPNPVKLGKVRWFERELVDQFLSAGAV
jgi:predicted DNA-binding transcriptional regulator AlpA